MRTISLKAAAVIGGVALVAGVGAALAFDGVAAPDPITLTTASDDAVPDTNSAPDGTDASSVAPDAGSSLDEAEARRLAVEAAGGGAAVHIRADRDDGRPEWEVLVRDADDRLIEVTLDATDGRVIETEVEDDDDHDGDDDDDDQRTAAATVSEQEAGRLALEATGGGEVLHAGPDEDDGRPEWDVDVIDADGRLVEVTIDATDGRVLEVDVED